MYIRVGQFGGQMKFFVTTPKNKRLINLIFNPISFALIFGTVIVLLFPDVFNKYQIKLNKKEKVLKGHYTYFVDLDSDGEAERIEIISPWNGQTAILLYKQGKVQYQFNFPGEWVININSFWGDVDNDNQLEIFICTLYQGKILLNCFNGITGAEFCTNLPLGHYKKINNTIDLSIYTGGLYDVNGDGIKEIYLSFTTGFSASFRQMLGVDLQSDSVFYAPQTCVNLLHPFSIDLDNDGQPEFTGNTQAVANCDTNVPYPDFYTWLLVLDSHLKFKFPPVRVGSFASRLMVVPVRNNNQNFLVALNINEGQSDSSSSLKIFDSQGKLIRSKIFPENSELSSVFLLRNSHNPGTFYLIQKNGVIEEWNFLLEKINEIKIKPLFSTFPLIVPIDANRFIYIFRLENFDDLYLVDDQFNNGIPITGAGGHEVRSVSLIGKDEKGIQLCITGNEYNYYYIYHRNSFFYFKYPVYLLIYLLSALLFFMLQKTLKIRAEQKFMAQKQIAELQLKAIKNQLHPHFTLNILNSIGSLFQSKNNEQADYLFGKYSKLLRQVIYDSDRFELSIDEEIEFVKNYLDLERFRLNNSFQYEIHVTDEDLRHIKIPKMLIHTFVENAVKHGLRDLDIPGKLSIEVKKEANHCLIIIDDNGIGRQQAGEKHSKGTGTGFKVLEQILDLYQYLENRKITYSIEDKYDKNKKSLGTKVTIRIPLHG